ncbi:MAG: SgcJ/EcaC family oxidoreductase [Gemmatimonadota bacterium]|nr:SgcJ/EcaC family oxidoreductase [Gemmatimonadota bacterium]
MKDRSRTRLAIALGVLALGACATTTVNQASEEQAIRAVGNEYMTAFNARDVDRLVGLHAPDAVVMVSNSPLATGSTEIRRSFSEFLSPGTSLSFTPTRINVVSPTVATEIGTYTLSFNTPQGRMTDRGNYTTIWHKINGQWRMAVDAPVSTTPMPMPGATPAVAHSPNVNIVANSSLAWSDFTPPGYAPGMKIARIQGDPSKVGEYTLRLQFPAGYRSPLHWHPGAENVTVVSGTVLFGMGNTADENNLRSYGPGDYLHIPPRHAHFAGSSASGPSVIQLHGIGPFQVILGAPQ